MARNTSQRGVSIRSIHMAMACLMLVISIALLVTTFSARAGYIRMRDNTEHFIAWEKNADDLQLASDYLTEQVRCFVETGKREYLDNYFKEANVTRRRENSLLHIEETFGQNEAYHSLEAALNESVELMDREYYAMRLTIAAYGYDYLEYPAEIQAIELSEEDALLPRERQEAKARDMVFDDVYHQRKNTITKDVQACISELTEEIGEQQVDASNHLDQTLLTERTLIILAITAALLTMLLTILLVVSPLLRAVMYIRSDEPIPIRGSNEFQFLAKTYNLMYEANREKKEQLAYDATHDKLTGIYNRAGYDFFLKNTSWEDAALLLIDVDKYKQVNDTYGHDVGDRVLQRVATVIKNAFRSQDYVCRIGGDEFAVIMVHTHSDHGELIKQKVEHINEVLQAPEDPDIPPVHLSCGVAFGTAGMESRAIYKRADTALYQVKGSGGCGCEIGL